MTRNSISFQKPGSNGPLDGVRCLATGLRYKNGWHLFVLPEGQERDSSSIRPSIPGLKENAKLILNRNSPIWLANIGHEITKSYPSISLYQIGTFSIPSN